MSRALSSFVTASMRAVRVSQFGGPEVLTLAHDVAIPKPDHTQILVKVGAAGVNPVDTYVRSGTYANPPPLPYTPGKDGAGVVQEIGTSVTKFKKGDRVYCAFNITGSYAQYMLTEETGTFNLHDNLSYIQGAGIGIPYCTAYRALVTRARCRPGQSLLVHGASGAVGIAACQIARSLGLHVIGTAGTQEGSAIVKCNGAHMVFNHREEGYVDHIKEVTGGQGVDVIIEMLANVNLETDLQLVANNGIIAVVGSRGSTEVNPRLAMGKESAIIGVQLQKTTQAEWEEMAAFLYAGQETGWLRPVIGQEYTFEQASTAHAEVMEHSTGSRGKIVLTIPEENTKII